MKVYSMACITSLLLALVISGTSYSQSDNIRFENFSGRRGLPEIGVNTILQDREGFMWFGTYEGLYRFDGHTTTVFQHDPMEPEHTLPSNLILDICEDRLGRFWVATPVGLLLVDKRTGRATTHRPDSTQAFGWNIIKAILEDRQGILWLGTSKGIARFDPTTFQFQLYPSKDAQFPDDLRQDNSDNLWGVTYEGVCRFHIPTGTFTLFPLMTKDGRKTIPRSLSIDTTGTAWIGTFGEGLFRMEISRPGQFAAYNPNGAVPKIIVEINQSEGNLWLAGEGVQRINPRTNKVVNYSSYDFRPGSLNSNAVSTLYHDRLGNLWVGTNYGVNKASIRSSPFYTYQLTPTPSSFMRQENVINNILEDHTGTVWVANDQNGLHRLDPTSQRLTPVTVTLEDSRKTVKGQQWPLLEDLEGRLWVATDLDKGLHVLDRRNNSFIRYDCEISIRVLAIAPSGTLWLGSDAGGIASFNPVTKKFTYYRPTGEPNGIPIGTYVNALLVDRLGEVWVGSKGRGVIHFNPNTGKFTHYLPNDQKPAGQINDLVALSLYEDQKGIIWIGTAEGGLNRFDPRTDVFTYFTIREGLASNAVTSITGDSKGNLWLGTTRGLSRFNPITLSCRNFDESDGLPDNFIVEGSIHMNKGKLFFGTRNGLVTFNPDSIIEGTSTLPVYITALKVGEKPVPLSAEIEFSYQENFLSFDFTAINYDSPDKTLYAYRLEGIDQDWVNCGNRRFASYTDLSSGSYVFRVKASIDNHVWQEAEALINIVIHPPWWQTWWAYGLYGLLGISLFLGLIHYSVSRERLKNDLKLQRLEAEKMHEIDHLKSRFFANISHEFRTPLTLILGPLEKFLSQPSVSSEDKTVFQMMQRNARRLLLLINQLLDLSKLEAGNMRLETKPSNIASFLKTIVLSFTSLAERRHIQYHFQYPTENPVVYFDSDKLEKIINNLLSNAFKFTPEGGMISVTARMLKTEDRAIPDSLRKQGHGSVISILELSVQDNGIGIPKDQLEKIFDRFHQTDTSHTREREGSGIGLSLVRELIELHSGEVVVDSQPGAGACFTVRLPLLVADFQEMVIVGHALDNGPQNFASIPDTAPEANKQSESVIENADADAPLVLIVEDNSDIRLFIRESLNHIYRVIEAVDGQEGYARAIETIPDLILSDVMMPKMDGLELCYKLKRDEKTEHIPLILLTAKASGEGKIEGLETGADDYIIKPVEAAELLARIKNLIEGHRKLRERFSREITLQPANIAITSMDEKLLQHVVQIMEEHMADVNFGVEAFCIEAGMSRMQLHRKLKALTDQSPGDFIRVMRLKRAVELLSRSAGSIAEVAFLVGFHDPSYFTKCFQKQFGKTPSEFIASREFQQ